jgi:DNA ligase D-like protein (predicted polymerase)/DNA ligase D-like protein (predicted 3'-phosphoesterase)
VWATTRFLFVACLCLRHGLNILWYAVNPHSTFSNTHAPAEGLAGMCFSPLLQKRMNLSLYNKKRNFENTPEPSGKEKASKGALRFVVQKHDATSLHYDFRLEGMGVLKSWAVPKGPSLNPADKRLAMQVEDHPYDYRKFEGVIPEGNYGAGTVIIWDEGTYEPADAGSDTKEAAETAVANALKSGNLKFVLHGKKLKGLFTLLQLKRDSSGKSWLLVKGKDDFSSEEDITLQNASVRSGKTIAQVAAEHGATPNHPEENKAAAKSRNRATTKTATVKQAATKTKKKTTKAAPVKLYAKTADLQLDKTAKEQTITLNKQSLTLTSLDKLYWKEETFSKGHMLNYYLQVAPYLLPYLLGRPQSLHRYPNGIDAPHFYQKDVLGKVPNWIAMHEDFSESTNEPVHYLVCTNEASLIYMANLGCIELHPWHSRIQTISNPDWCLIDLDPDAGNSYGQVVETAQVVKKLLDEIGASSYPKTSGSTGLHIYIPLGAKWSYEKSKELAETVVTLANRELPNITSLERAPEKRKGKIYLDFLQNSETQTAAAPYSLRPKRGMPVSTPLHWDEVKQGLTPTVFTAITIFERLKQEGDLFKPVLGRGIDLPKVLAKAQTLLA